jgi:hypothetical protein
MLQGQFDKARWDGLGRGGGVILGDRRQILEPGQAMGLEAGFPLAEANADHQPQWRRSDGVVGDGGLRG